MCKQNKMRYLKTRHLKVYEGTIRGLILPISVETNSKTSADFASLLGHLPDKINFGLRLLAFVVECSES